MPERTETSAPDWMPPTASAQYLGVSTRTLLRWEEDGRITSVKTPGGHRRYRRSDLDRLLRTATLGRQQPGAGGGVGA